MAGPYYVRSTDGSDASDGLTWANAKATLVGALAVAVAGERIWVSQAHAETQASAMTLTSAGTAAAPIEILCGNDAAEPPTALATTATITTTGASTMAFGAGMASVYGIIFNAGTGAVTASINLITSASNWRFDTCELALLSTGTSSLIGLGVDGAGRQFIKLVNCILRRSQASQRVALRCRVLWNGGSLAGTAPSFAVSPGTASLTATRIRAVDLSLAVTNLVEVVGSGIVSFENCKLGAAVTVPSGTNPGPHGPIVQVDNCDSADTQVRMQRHQYEGDVYSETTIVRTGGASNGTTPLSHKMVSSAARTFHTPLYGPEMVIWNNTTGSAKTATVEIVHDSVTALTDAEVWLEVEYLGTAGFPLALFANDRKADVLATAANQAASALPWTTTGITNVNAQQVAVTFTPQEIGIVRCRVALAKASYTVYVDPLVVIS